VKLSVRQSEEEVAAVDKYAHAASLTSPSAALQHGGRSLGDPELEDAYVAAWDEWEAAGDALAWEATAADGLVGAAR
jgi:hypothetical protein